MASSSVIQKREGEWTSAKYWDVLGLYIPCSFTNDPALLADHITNFETQPDDVFVVCAAEFIARIAFVHCKIYYFRGNV